jgi:hypothetical protein
LGEADTNESKTFHDIYFWLNFLLVEINKRLDEEFWIGRNTDCQQTFDNRLISGKHCRIARESGAETISITDTRYNFLELLIKIVQTGHGLMVKR